MLGACPQERSSERGCKTDEILCRKSVALDLARGSDFPFAAFQEVAVWKHIGPWVSSLVVSDLGSSCEGLESGGGSQSDCSDLLGHQTGPPLGKLCDYLFPKKHLVL